MAIGIYFNPPSMTVTQYDEIVRRLEAAGLGNPAGRMHHVCFGSEGKLQVFDVWASQQDFDKFGKALMPIARELGADPGQPMIEPVHNVILG